MNTSFKPHVEPDARMGYVCKGLGIEAHGMTAEAAYASWEHRFMQRAAAPAPRCPDFLDADMARPFCYEPL
jgi:hypothetical protein